VASTHVVPAAPDRDAIKRALYGSGITTLRGAVSRDFVAGVREDLERAFAASIARAGDAAGRYHVELHPHTLRGFVELVTHPWFVTVCETVLGADYEIVRLGFDLTLPDAPAQPWHRDFPSPIATAKHRRLTSLVFGLTCVDTTPEMGPSEIARGTQWETGADWPDGMFPPEHEWPRYDALAMTKLPQVGDLSARSALAIHRGTANRSAQARAVLVVGVAAATAGHTARCAPQVTPDYYATLPAALRKHLVCRIADELPPIVREPQVDGPTIA